MKVALVGLKSATRLFLDKGRVGITGSIELVPDLK